MSVAEVEQLPGFFETEEPTVVEPTQWTPLCLDCQHPTTAITAEHDLACTPRAQWPCCRAGNMSYCATTKRIAYSDGDADEIASEEVRKATILAFRRPRSI